MRVLLLFIDGVGLGPDDASNPMATTSLPSITKLLDGRRPILEETPLHAASASLVGLDATLGVDGTPQSGTGQAALFTGTNAAVLHGRHFGPWVPAALRPMLRRQSVLARAAAAGRTIAFANAYPRALIDLAATELESHEPQANAPQANAQPHEPPPHVVRRKKLPQFLRAGPPVVAMGAGALTRDATDIASGNAVASEITNEGWRERLGHTELPVSTPADAGRTLARIASQHDLTLFAHYSTDSAGHAQDAQIAAVALQKVDAFIGSVAQHVPQDCVIIVTSDHGNIEDIRADHTRNPAIGLVVGRDQESIARRLTSLLDVTPVILDLLERH